LITFMLATVTHIPGPTAGYFSNDQYEVIAVAEMCDMRGAVYRSTGSKKRYYFGRAPRADELTQIDGRQIRAQMGVWGSPKKVPDGVRVGVFMDSETRNIAFEIGNGNVSEGVRKLARFYSESKVPKPRYVQLQRLDLGDEVNEDVYEPA
jgi:hypothetical protein